MIGESRLIGAPRSPLFRTLVFFQLGLRDFGEMKTVEKEQHVNISLGFTGIGSDKPDKLILAEPDLRFRFGRDDTNHFLCNFGFKSVSSRVDSTCFGFESV